jgi:hypothetical protein
MAMNHARKHALADATAEALALQATKLDAMDQRQKADTAELRGDVAELRGDVARLEGMMSQVLQGIAALAQNDMETVRRLNGQDQRLAEILDRLPRR